MECVLEMKGIQKSFPGIKVLNDVNLKVYPGEVHALMGENGAGKSTLMKILMGIYKADEGQVFLDGKEADINGPGNAMKKGISMIHQELNTLMDMEVAENVFVGRELLKKGFEKLKITDKSLMRKETKRYFDDMGIHIDPSALMRTLSVAQMQLVEIVKAISLNSKVIIMDEPTSAITEREAEVLFDQINKLKGKGVSIIYISHKMDEIFRIADVITVLRDGECIGTKPVDEVTEEELIRMMVGREISEVYPKEHVDIGGPVLEVKHLSRGKKVKDVSFVLNQGEVLGIAGLVGAGRSELVETIFGVYPKTGGQIFLDGREVHLKHPKDAIRSGIALITEDRKQTGLNLIASVKDNIAVVSLSTRLSHNGIVNSKKERQAASQYIEELRIKSPSSDVIAGNLSGGNQQKVVLAKWLLGEPRIIIMDEPTRGIDVGAKRDIYLLINKLAKQGKSIIVISSELPEVMGISDRVIIMCEGKITGEISREQYSQELIMTYASRTEGRVS